MAKTKGNTRQREYRSWFTKDNTNHLLFTYRELSFEILGGVNTESYVMLRVMLIVKGNNKVERDHIDLYNNYQRTGFTKRISERIGFSLEYVEEAFEKLTNELETYKHECIEKRKAKYDNDVSVDGDDRIKAEAVLKSPNLLKELSLLVTKAGVVGNKEQSLMLFLTYLSRLQEHPLHAIVQSKYHYLQAKVGGLVPDEHKLVISHLSENALYYFDEDELAHKLLLVEDTGSNKQALVPLLSLQAKGRLCKTITQKDGLGKLRTVQKTVNGPISLSISTSQDQNFHDNTPLSFVIKEETGAVQDERIMTYQRKRSARIIRDYKEQEAKQELWNIQRMLSPINVMNPRAEYLILPESLKNKQISNIQYLRFIELITFVKQNQKEQYTEQRTGEIYIKTDISDIEEAHKLLENVLIQKCDDLNTQTRHYFEKLQHYITSKSLSQSVDDDQPTKANPNSSLSCNDFTNRELQQHTQIPISTIKRYHQTLLLKGYITATGEGNRAVGFSYRITRQESQDDIKKQIRTTLNTSLKMVKGCEGSPKPTVAQNQNGLPKTSNHVG